MCTATLRALAWPYCDINSVIWPAGQTVQPIQYVHTCFIVVILLFAVISCDLWAPNNQCNHIYVKLLCKVRFCVIAKQSVSDSVKGVILSLSIVEKLYCTTFFNQILTNKLDLIELNRQLIKAPSNDKWVPFDTIDWAWVWFQLTSLLQFIHSWDCIHICT